MTMLISNLGFSYIFSIDGQIFISLTSSIFSLRQQNMEHHAYANFETQSVLNISVINGWKITHDESVS